MHTATARKIAEERHKLLADYIEALRKEIG
jgi:HD superfamily phosphodiesterase